MLRVQEQRFRLVLEELEEVDNLVVRLVIQPPPDRLVFLLQCPTLTRLYPVLVVPCKAQVMPHGSAECYLESMMTGTYKEARQGRRRSEGIQRSQCSQNPQSQYSSFANGIGFWFNVRHSPNELATEHA